MATEAFTGLQSLHVSLRHSHDCLRFFPGGWRGHLCFPQWKERGRGDKERPHEEALLRHPKTQGASAGRIRAKDYSPLGAGELFSPGGSRPGRFLQRKRGGVFVFDHPRLKLWSKEPRGFAFGYWHWDWADELLHHGPHSAILFDGNEHRIEKNEIHHVLLETGDCSAIYTGRDWTLHGTVIRWNFIHDLPGTPGRQQNAVYLDDMASGIRVEGNIFFRCNSGMLVGGGRDNRIAHNLFIDSKLGIRFDQRGVTWMAKKLKDPRTSTILRRLQAIPIQKEPWRSRYPSLRTYLSDRIGKPVGSSVVENVFYQTKLGTIADPKTVKVRGNLVKQGRPGIVEEKNGGLPFRMKRFALCPQGSLVFPPSLLTKSEGRVPRTKNEDHLPSKGGCFLRPSQRQVFDDCPNFSRRVLFYYCPKERKELGFPPDRGEMAEWPNATAC